MNKKKLVVENIVKQFTDVAALKGVSIALKEGQLLAVLGPSGCGKTTLLRAIAGFETPDEGSIRIDDRVMFDAAQRVNIKPEQRKIGYVPQHGVLFPHLRVEKNIAFGLPSGGKGMSAAQKARRVDEMLELVGMSGLGKRMPHELSGGQQQRIALARALAPSPSLVLLDEPFSALDAGLRQALRAEVKSTLNQIGATAIIVTHDQEEALSMADNVAVMRDGLCVQVDDPVTIYQYPADLQVAQFVGEATLAAATITPNNQVMSSLGTFDLAQQSPVQSGEVTMMIRPEQFRISSAETAQIEGKVASNTYCGHSSLVHIQTTAQCGGLPIQVRLNGMQNLHAGDTIYLSVEGHVMAYY